jgi:hypothetical protein
MAARAVLRFRLRCRAILYGELDLFGRMDFQQMGKKIMPEDLKMTT